MPVIPAAQEAEVGGSLEPRSLWIQEVMIVPLYFIQPGQQSKTLSQKKDESHLVI